MSVSEALSQPAGSGREMSVFERRFPCSRQKPQRQARLGCIRCNVAREGEVQQRDMASTARVNGWLLADLFRPVKRRCGRGTLIPAPCGSGADQSNQGPLSTSGGCPNPLRHLQEFPSLTSLV